MNDMSLVEDKLHNPLFDKPVEARYLNTDATNMRAPLPIEVIGLICRELCDVVAVGTLESIQLLSRKCHDVATPYLYGRMRCRTELSGILKLIDEIPRTRSNAILTPVIDLNERKTHIVDLPSEQRLYHCISTIQHITVDWVHYAEEFKICKYLSATDWSSLRSICITEDAIHTAIYVRQQNKLQRDGNGTILHFISKMADKVKICISIPKPFIGHYQPSINIGRMIPDPTLRRSSLYSQKSYEQLSIMPLFDKLVQKATYVSVHEKAEHCYRALRSFSCLSFIAYDPPVEKQEEIPMRVMLSYCESRAYMIFELLEGRLSVKDSSSSRKAIRIIRPLDNLFNRPYTMSPDISSQMLEWILLSLRRNIEWWAEEEAKVKDVQFDHEAYAQEWMEHIEWVTPENVNLVRVCASCDELR